MKFNPAKVFVVLIGGILFFSQGIKPQDSLQTSVPYRVNWLIHLAELKEPAMVADSIEARGYKPIATNDFGNTPGGFMLMFKLTGSTNYYGLMSKDGEEVTACGYFTTDEDIYKQIVVSISKMGFRTTSLYQTAPGELAFYKENILLVLKTTTSQNKNNYILNASKFVM
jgi:hypothetical protein